jgi:hypothetical protein
MGHHIVVDPCSQWQVIEEDAPTVAEPSADQNGEHSCLISPTLRINYIAVSIRSCFLLLGREKKQNWAQVFFVFVGGCDRVAFLATYSAMYWTAAYETQQKEIKIPVIETVTNDHEYILYI